MRIAVVIPAYRVSRQIKDVVLSVPDTVDHVIVVDDACPEASGKLVEEMHRENVTVVYHQRNRGVGGATVTGYKQALAFGCGVAVKMDGDGQMDPAYLDSLIEPIVRGQADCTKGNRFRDFARLRTMPKCRLLGNSMLSFAVKVASGYWDIMDPTNGYTAVHRRVLEELDLDRLPRRYFFESGTLIRLNIANAVVRDVSIPARYGSESSSLSILKILLFFPFGLLFGLIRRILLKYYIYDFNMASVYLLLGLPMFLFGVVYGSLMWVRSITTGLPTPAGTIMLAALPVIVGLEMLLQAISIDIHSVPRKK
ncbi:MAG: glycosyltransferase family 2 protein [Planctomycetota bacterium]|jgi:glycosyltransferase involved in cell wall biosynthesis